MTVVGFVMLQVMLMTGAVSAQDQPDNERSKLRALVAQNSSAWALFMRSDDADSLRAAATRMEQVLAEIEGDERARIYLPYFTDTYANLLYKVGRVDEAIRWQEKALAAIPSDQKGRVRVEVERRLEQMKQGEPTWPQPSEGAGTGHKD